MDSTGVSWVSLHAEYITPCSRIIQLVDQTMQVDYLLTMGLALRELVIEPEGVSRPDMRELVMEHFKEMIATAAPESSHALDLESLARPEITLFGARRGGQLLGCGALKKLTTDAGEIKTMRTVEAARGMGIGGILLDRLLSEARSRGYEAVYLETGSEPFFGPARSLYRSRGFVRCAPFASYKEDPHSVFMSLQI